MTDTVLVTEWGFLRFFYRDVGACHEHGAYWPPLVWKKHDEKMAGDGYCSCTGHRHGCK